MLRQLAVEMRTDYQASSQPQFFEGKEIFLEGGGRTYLRRAAAPGPVTNVSAALW